jgi:hypothetical protein
LKLNNGIQLAALWVATDSQIGKLRKISMHSDRDKEMANESNDKLII